LAVEGPKLFKRVFKAAAQRLLFKMQKLLSSERPSTSEEWCIKDHQMSDVFRALTSLIRSFLLSIIIPS
jgi:hypothetical protein